MPIEIEAPDGAIVEFPDGTDDATITRAMQQAYGGPDQAQSVPDQPAADQPRYNISALDASTSGVGNAITLGWGDELAGAVFAPFEAAYDWAKGDGFDLKRGYERARDRGQAYTDQAREEHPVASFTGEMAGALVGGAPVAKGIDAALQGTRLATQTIPRLAAEGATLGAIYGAGDSRPGERTDGAITGGIAGGIVGGAIPAGAKAFGAVKNRAPAPVRKAAKRIMESLGADDLSLDKALGRMQRRGGTFMEAGDDNLLGLGRSISTNPGPGRNVINKGLDRGQAARAGKIMSAVDDGLGGGDISFNRRLDAMKASKSKVANKLYNQAFEKNFPNGHLMEFDQIQSRLPADAVRNAQKVAQAEGRPFGEQLIASIDDASNTVTFRRAPSLREWHYIQRGLRTSTDQAFKSGAGEVGTAYSGLRKELLAAMDKSNPLYKSTRETYATASQMEDALQRGREILKPGTLNNLDTLADDLASMSKQERQMMRLGLARSIEDNVLSTPDAAGNAVNKIFGTPQKRTAIRSLFENASDFRKFELEMRQLAKAAKGFGRTRMNSVSGEKLAEVGAFNNAIEFGEPLAEISTGGYIRGTINLVKKIMGKAKVDNKMALQVAKILMEKDPEVVRAALSGNRQAAAQLSERVRVLIPGISAEAGKLVGAQ